jgi:multimeric flavodoxin WrbA
MSNSWLMIRKAMEYLSKNEDVTTHAFNLATMNIEHCNGCYSSTGSLCRFPCDCWPYDDMQDIYAQLTLADGILFSTGVNQFLPSSRLKQVLDRLISMDGGRFAPEYNVDGKTWKDAETKNAEQRVALRGDFRYVQRLAGKVCAAFTTGKDYGTFKVGMDILAGMNMFGCFLPPNSVMSWNSPRVQKDTAYDKADFLQDLESDGWIGGQIERICDAVVETARLVRGKETLWMDDVVGRS